MKGQSIHKYQASNAGEDGFSQSGIPFALSASGTLEACVGGSAEFSVLVRGTEAYNYTWKKIGDAAFRAEAKPTLRLSSVTQAQAGRYYCIVEDLNGKLAAYSDTLELKVFDSPTVRLSTEGGKNRIARGDSVRLIKEVNAGNYYWNVDVPASGWVKPRQSTSYILTGENGGRCTAMASVDVEVVDLYLQPGPSLQISLGQDGILSVNTNADTVLWYAKAPVRAAGMSRMSFAASHPEWGDYVGSGRSIRVSPVTSMVYTAVGYVGTYAAVTTLSVGIKDTYKGGVEDGFTQSDVPFGILPLADTLRVCQDDSIAFVAMAQGVSAYDYTWYHMTGSGNLRLAERNICKLTNCTFTDEGRYFCVVTDRLSGYAQHSDTIYLKVDERPYVKIISPLTDTVICYGDTLSLTAGLQPALAHTSFAEIRFQWAGIGLVSGENDRTARVAPATRTTYMVTAENHGCRSVDTLSVGVNVPYIDLPSFTVASEHGRVLVTARELGGNVINPSAVDRFEWGVNDTLVSFTPVTNPLVIGDFIPGMTKAWATMKVGECTASDTTYFQMKVGTSFYGGWDDGFAQSDIPFGISPLPDTTFVCQNDSAMLQVTANGVSLYDYVWYKVSNPADDSLGNKNSCMLRNCDFPTEGEYYCKVTDKLSGFSKYSDTTYVYVNERPRVQVYEPAGDTLICYGDTIYLIAHLNPALTRLSASDVNYAWTGNSIVWGQNGAAALVAPSVKTEYIVKADYKGCETSDTLTVDVNTPYVDLPATLVVGENSPADVYARNKAGDTINPATTTQFVWGINASAVISSVNPLHIPQVRSTMEKVWVAVQFGNCGASDTAYIKLKTGTSFYGGPDDGFTASCIEPAILQQFGQEKLVCQADGNNAMADSVVLRLVYEGTDVEFQWEKFNTAISDFEAVGNGNGVQGANGPLLKFKPLEVSHNGSYRCVLKNYCSDKVVVSDTFTVSVKGEPVIKSSTNNGRIRCRNENGDFTYNVIAEGATPDDEIHYQWSKDGVDLPGENRNYLIRSLREADNMVNGKYVSPAGLYVLRIWNDCGTVYDSANLVVNEPAYLVKQVDDPVYACKGERKEFSVQVAGGGIYQYELLEVNVGCDNVGDVESNIINSWAGFSKISIPVTSPGKYIWRFKNECCNGEWKYSAFMTLRIDERPSFVSVPEAQELCIGETLSLTCQASADTRNFYYWEKDNVILPGQTSATLLISNVKASDAGVYRCYVYNECNPVASEPIQVKVTDKPQLVSISNIEQDYCEGDSVEIKANVSSLWPLDSIRWHYKGALLTDDAAGHIVGSHSSLLRINGVKKEDAEGAYMVEMMNKCGSNWSLPVSFKLKEPAKFVRGLDRDVELVMCLGTSQTLTVVTTGTPPIRYIWTHNGDTIANGNTNTLPITNAQADTAGEYVCHIQNGCGDDITKTAITVSYADTFRFVGGGRYCAGDGGLSAELLGSDTSTLYRLYKEGVSVPLREIHGRDVVPMRGHIVFDNLTAGTYYVTGTNRYNCEDRMPGEAEIIEEPLPEDYKLYVERHMCVGDSTGDLAIPGSQSGILYYLLKDKPGGWDTLRPPYAGTGNPLLMSVGTGFYKLYAVDTATGCARALSGLDSITPRPYPQECELGVWNDDSVYCRGSQSDVVLTYDCFESGSSYTLWKNGHLMNPPKHSAPLRWPGVEEGVYNIRVMNEWGCTRDFGRQEVKVQELPRRFPLVGARIYCKDEPGPHRLDLQDSEEGVKYSFRYLPSGVVKDTMGVGGEIRVEVPLEERKYYVIATDTTPEHCSVPMLDTVEVRMSRLEVHPNPAVIYVEYGQVAQLNIVIQHAEGTPVVTWTDNGYLADSVHVQNPKTKPCTWMSENFLVSVTDASGCQVVTSVKVVRIGGELEGEIREEDCLTPVDTMVVCEGSDVELCAYAAGGQGFFDYTWSDLNNPDLGHGDKLTYTPSSEGYVWLDIQSGQQKIRDSVYIVMGTTPRIDTLEPLYSRCVTPGTPEQIVLKNSESGNSYSLEYSADGLTYNYVSLTPTYGGDGKVTFSLLNAAQFPGYLRIVAERISPDGKITCRAVMDQTVEIRVAPEKFNVKGGWNYCGNDAVRDTVVVDGAQEGVTYHLKKLPGTEIAAVTAVPGQDSVLFVGRYTAGEYIVVAEIGACRDTMKGVVKIVADTLPPIGTLENQGAHCAMDCPVEIAITQAIPGVDYYLVLDSLNGGRSSTHFKTSSAGRLSFGTYCELGRYSVKAVNAVTTCENEKAEVLIRETPDIQHLLGDTLYCEGDFGVKLALDSTENGVTYYVQKWEADTNCADSSKWVNVSPAVVIHGNGFPVSISSYFTDGFYRLMSSEPCPAAMDSLRVRMIPLPEDTLKLQLEGNGCIDSAFVLRIAPIETDVNYTLRFNGVPVTETPVTTATGLEWHFTSGNAGNYSVFAERGMCSTVLRDSVKVDSLPRIWPLEGVTQLCQNDKGTLFMASSEQGVVYSLYDTAAHAFTVQGTIRHDSVIFEGVQPGTYYPQAAKGNCFVNGDLYTIQALPAPAPVQMEAADCIEAGKGWVKLSGLQDSLEYVTPWGTLRRFSGDTTFTELPAGIYCVTVKDTLLGCESLRVCDTIREGVGTDSITGDFYYCEEKFGDGKGVTLTLSGTRVGVDYSILDKNGNTLMTIRRPDRVFPDNLLQDTFIFRKERPGYLGGCRIDSVFEVKEIPLPADSLEIELTGGSVLCAGGRYYVNVRQSQKDKWYILRKQGSQVGLDTVTGQEGMTVTFPKPLTEAGRYEIYVRDVRQDCGTYLDTLITIAPQPQPVVIDSCFYCYDYDDVPEGDSCRIGLRGMLTGTIYRLNNGAELDTLIGPGNGLFADRPAGDYKIIAENKQTGCIDTMETSIRAVRRPRILDVVVDCGEQGVLDTIYTYHRSEADEDSVVYYLYREGVRQTVSQVGDGVNPVTFGHLTQAGVYKIYAEKRNSLCGVFMNDSIVITPPLDCKDTLQIIGEVCRNSGDKVGLQYNCSVTGWKYYLRSELCDFDTIAGGGRLMWSVGEGKYILRAYNDCGKTVNLDTVDVIGKPSPNVYTILNKNFSLCEGKTFDIVLSGSEEDVVYTVVDGSGRVKVSVTGHAGGGTLFLGTFGAAGQYEVWAEKNGCKRFMDKVIVAPALLPEDVQVLGSDKCLAGGVNDSIRLCLASRENNVSYYLYLNGRTVLDSLTALRPGELCFNKQDSVGRYTVIAVHPTSKCRKEMPGAYKMSTPAVAQDLENPGEIIHICQGTDTCLYLEDSETGIDYFLKRNGTTLSSSVYTATGGRLKVACVSQSGKYQVVGKVGECETLMNDTVVVEVHPLPHLDVERELHYCEFSAGADVTVAYPTDSTVMYELYSPNGVVPLDVRYGNGDKTGFMFSVRADSVGYYRVVATDTAAGCSEEKRIDVIEDKLPLDYDLISSNGKYLCADGSGTGTYFSLSGSEKGVTYTLYRLSPREDIVSKDGTGSEFRFPKEVRDTGVYMVRAENLLSGCENSFSPVRLLRADTVRRYDVISVVNRYCSLSDDPDKGIIQLSSSQPGVEYEIYRDGVPLGMQQMGTGGPLLWKGLEGELCRHLGYPPRGGAVYAVMARDTLTNCMKQMNGTDTIVAEERIEVLAQEPNEDIAVCEKDSVQFSVTTSGCGEHYQWYHNGAALAGENKAYYNIRSLNTMNDPGYYYCSISNTCGTAESQMVKLTIYPLVSVKKKMEPVIVCNPQQKNVLLASAFANAQYFVWYRAEETEEEWLSLGSTYEIVDFDTTKVGKYVCKAWNGNNCNVVYDTCEVKMGSLPDVTVMAGGDTLLCNGLGSYIMEVHPGAGVSIEWEFNGQLTGDTGNLYTLSPVTTADEGLYAVRARNKCGTAAINVGQVLVDDSLKITEMSEKIMLRCPDEYETLFLTVEPANRVSYHWYQTPDVSTIVSSESSFRVGPMGTASPLNYRVVYSNKCSAGEQDFVIHVPQKIETDPLPRMISACADCATDTVLRLNVDASMFAQFKWFYRVNELDTNRISIENDSDTLAVRLCTGSTGYYYCKVYNRCETDFTTETSWIRIDTVPVIKNTLPVIDSVCEGLSYVHALSATGGGLKYTWVIGKKDGTEQKIVNRNEAFASTSELNITNIGLEYDSCRIICYVENECGKDTSSMMLLRVLPMPQVRISPVEQKICTEDTAMLEIELIVGASPWGYKMEWPDKSLHTVSGVQQVKDTMKVKQSGKYSITYLSDASGCVRNQDLPVAEVQYDSPASLVMSGSKEICMDDSVSIHFSVSGGIGPWKIKVVDVFRGGLAEEICGTDALVMYGRDTVVRFFADSSAEYSLYSVVDMGTGCHLPLQDSSVIIGVHFPEHISFKDGPWYVGQCRNVNLRTYLEPRLSDGSLLPSGTGHFFIGGVDRGTNALWLKEDLRGDSCYRVKCEYRDSAGCLVTSDEIRICVDSLPSGEIISSSISCESVATDFMLQLHPAGRIDSLVILQTRYKKGGASSMQLLSYNRSQLPLDGLFKLRLNWGDVGGADSCLVYEVQGIRDIHGCWMGYDAAVYDSLYRDTIWRHVDPKVDVQVRRSVSKPWDTGVHEMSLGENDSVQVKVTLTDGMPLWALPTLGMSSIAGRDTVFWLKDTGTYWFIPTDVACGRQGAKPWYDLTLTRLDTGYFRGRVFLEGVFDETNMSMAWGNNCNWTRLEDSLRLPSSLPLLPSGLKVIDWIEVELRISNGSPIDSVAAMSDPSFFVTRDTCLVLSDGHLADRWTGDTVVGIRNAYGAGANQRYVVVRHRSHLGVMTNGLHRFVNRANVASATYVDFTDVNRIYYKGGPLNSMDYHMTKKSSQGKEVWVLAVGSLDSNSLVSLSDPNHVTLEDIKPLDNRWGYRYDLLHDINLDGCVDWPNWNGTTMTDWLFVERNRSKYTEIRWDR